MFNFIHVFFLKKMMDQCCPSPRRDVLKPIVRPLAKESKLLSLFRYSLLPVLAKGSCQSSLVPIISLPSVSFLSSSSLRALRAAVMDQADLDRYKAMI